MTEYEHDELPRSEVFVSPEEAGQKLLQFLARRLDMPQSALHRWIRTGQVRLNGKRTQAFTRLNAGDAIRLPPFALHDAKEIETNNEEPGTLPPPDILLSTHALFVCVKPAGLPTHDGTGHTDSLVARLHAHCASGSFMPTPAHRLDKPTSGLVLVARSYTALSLLHKAMIKRDALIKTYLAWVQGNCHWNGPVLLEDGIQKVTFEDGRERMELIPLERASKKASLTAEVLERRAGASLMRLTLHTGRTHQIRAQMAGHGFPLLGDVKYGGQACDQGLMLHAAWLSFSARLADALGLPDTRIYCPPSWLEPWDTDE